MAKKEESKIVLERTYNVPLRRFWLYTPKYRRAKRAVNALWDFISKHMKSKEIRIGKYANQEIWQRGIQSPPHHIKVEAKKDDKGIVFVESVNAPKEKPKREKKPAKEPKLEEKAATEDVKPAEKAAEKKEIKQDREGHDHAGHSHEQKK